jgi:SAM-dependent methyltransferase
MNSKENLDKYFSAYSNSFKFLNDNEIFLTKFASYLQIDIDKNTPIENFISLGIGYKIVSDTIIQNVLNSKIKKYFIIDGSENLVNEYKSKFKDLNNIYVIHSYFEEFIPENNLKFDRIEMGFILEHVDDPLFILKKYKEYLSPNGIIHIAVPNARSLHRLIGYKAGLLDDVYKLSEYDLMLGHKRYYDIDTIKDQIINAGLKILDIKGLMLKPITADQMKQIGFFENENIIKALVEIGEHYPEIANCIYLKASL